MTDAVEVFLDHLRSGRRDRARRAYAELLGEVSTALGPYRALVDIEDDELAAVAEELWAHSPVAVRRRNQIRLGSWSAWCLAAQLPVPSLPTWP